MSSFVMVDRGELAGVLDSVQWIYKSYGMMSCPMCGAGFPAFDRSHENEMQHQSGCKLRALLDHIGGR